MTEFARGWETGDGGKLTQIPAVDIIPTYGKFKLVVVRLDHCWSSEKTSLCTANRM